MKKTHGILKNLPAVLRIVRDETKRWKPPIVGTFAEEENAPFKILISTVLSLRTKDATTGEASLRLFQLADTAEKMRQLPLSLVEKTIYPVGFYRTKAKNILDICRLLCERFDGQVPSDIETLLTFPGVGRKTANLVVTVGYGKLGICVDTHVHRISNRWGLVRTRTPEETEFALRKKLPEKYWIEFNDLLVSYGQNLCLPISPWCSRCKIHAYCPRLGVKTAR